VKLYVLVPITVSDLSGKQRIILVDYLISAAWHGTRIILRQVSLVSLTLSRNFTVAARATRKMLIEENEITADEYDAFFDYAATFLHNIGIC
jgi:hypothetical protein